MGKSKPRTMPLLPPPTPPVDCPLPLRLRTQLRRWETLCSPGSPILEWISEGYQPTFLGHPPSPDQMPAHRPTPAADRLWLENELVELQRLGVLRPLQPTESPLWISPVTVVRHNNNRRTIVDLSALNSFLVPAPTFKMPTIADLAPTATHHVTNRAASKFDITKMFFHIPLHRNFQLWICIKAPSGQVLVFQALPMGLQQAPWVATKALAPVVHLARRLAPPSATVLQYMDDGLVEALWTEAQQAATTYAATLTALGWLLSEKKCQPTPTTTIDFLGHQLTWTSTCWTATLLPSRRVAIRRHLRDMLKHAPPPKRLAQSLGELAFVTMVVPLCRAMTRPLYADLATATQGNRRWTSRTPIDLSTSSCRAVRCLLDVLQQPHVLQCRLERPPPPTVVITTDASSEWGWGAVLASPSSPEETKDMAQDRWPTFPPSLLPPTAVQVVQALGATTTSKAHTVATIWDRHFPPHLATPAAHITALETTAALFAVMTWGRGQVPALRTDCSTTVAALVRRSSASPAINQLAALLDVARLALQLPSLNVTHLAGHLNTQADEASRRWIDSRGKLEWPCHRQAFLDIWTTLTGSAPPPWAIDAFASTGNAQLRRFWALRPTTPLAEAVDALAQRWSDLWLWINPPFHLMAQVVAKLLQDRPHLAILLTPDWPHTWWWRALAGLASASILLHPINVVEAGPTTNLPEPLRNPRWMLRAWRIDGR